MKKYILLLFSLIVFTNCQEKINEADYEIFGESFDINEKAITKADLLKFYQDDKRTDTLDVVFSSKITDVCQKKGCWMTLELGDDEENFIKFKDYAFFVPLNASGSEVIIKGKAYRSVETIEALKHYAEDAGKTPEEIDAIKEPEVSYNFMAEGVYIKK